MSDIVERLRDINRNPPILHERQHIADEIESLRARLADLAVSHDLHAKHREAAEARLAAADALLRETVHPTQYAIIPTGWIGRRDAHLAREGEK
jgi:hypothetical protein